MPHNLFVTNLFGGSMANEGLGILSLSFDWQFIGGGQNPMWMPYRTLVNEIVSYLISIGIYMGLYYGNVWQALKFPFLSPMLYSEKSTSKRFIPYNTTAILNKKMEVQDSLLQIHGLPYKTSAAVFASTGINAAISATFVHMFLWHYQDLKSAWSFFTVENFKQLGRPKEWNLKFWTWKNKVVTQEEADAIDPHYGLMMAYKDIPQWVVWSDSRHLHDNRSHCLLLGRDYSAMVGFPYRHQPFRYMSHILCCSNGDVRVLSYGSAAHPADRRLPHSRQTRRRTCTSRPTASILYTRPSFFSGI